MHREDSLILRDVLMDAYSNESLGVILILCPFSKVIVVGSTLGPMTCLVTDFDLFSSDTNVLHLME